MNSERSRNIERLYHSALERPSRDREAFLENECRGDEDLRLDVQSLLSRAASAENVLDRPAAAVAAHMMSQPAAPVLTGRRLGVYEVQAPIGAGGMGVVYRALDTNLNRPVAIKFLSDELANPAARRQITSEGYAFLPSVSPDGKKLYYLVRAGGARNFVTGGLWVADLESGQRQRLLPDFRMRHYTISADGQRVVFVASDDAGRTPVWLAGLNGRSAPRRLTAMDSGLAYFGAPARWCSRARKRR